VSDVARTEQNICDVPTCQGAGETYTILRGEDVVVRVDLCDTHAETGPPLRQVMGLGQPVIPHVREGRLRTADPEWLGQLPNFDQ
jgi:hypothetical protein